MAEKLGSDIGASFVASGDLSAFQFKPVCYGIDGKHVVVPAVAGALAGVLQNKPKNGEHAAVVGFGYSKLSLVGSIGIGEEWGPGVSGAVLATSGNWSGGHIITSATSGDITEVYVSISRKTTGPTL